MRMAMISQPMRGKTEEEIIAARNEASQRLENMGYTVVDTYYNKYSVPCYANNGALYHLGQSLTEMARCDAVYFCKGWEDARGCRIEHEAAKAYDGIMCIYEEATTDD